MHISQEIFNNLCHWCDINDDQVFLCKQAILELFSELKVNFPFKEFYVGSREIKSSVWINEDTQLLDENGETVYKLDGCRINIASNKECSYPCYELFIDGNYEVIYIDLLEEKKIDLDAIKNEDNGNLRMVKLNDVYTINYDFDQSTYVLKNNQTNELKPVTFNYKCTYRHYFYDGKFYLMDYHNKDNTVEFIYAFPDYGMTYIKCLLDLTSGIVTCDGDRNFDYPEPMSAKCINGKDFYVYLLTDSPKVTKLYDSTRTSPITTIDGFYPSSVYDKWVKIF